MLFNNTRDSIFSWLTGRTQYKWRISSIRILWLLLQVSLNSIYNFRMSDVTQKLSCKRIAHNSFFNIQVISFVCFFWCVIFSTFRIFLFHSTLNSCIAKRVPLAEFQQKHKKKTQMKKWNYTVKSKYTESKEYRKEMVRLIRLYNCVN